MAKDVLKFRCYACNKLLGASASRAGKTIACPSCKAELVVPDPAAESRSDPEIEAAARAIGPIVDDTSRLRSPAASASTATKAPALEPAFSWEDVDTALFEDVRTGEPPPVAVSAAPPAAPEITPPGEPVAPLISLSTLAPAPAPPLPIDATRPLVAESSVATAPKGRRRRSGEVVISQSLIVSWLVFVSMAMGIAFVIGVFVGHYLWKR